MWALRLTAQVLVSLLVEEKERENVSKGGWGNLNANFIDIASEFVLRLIQA